MKSQNLATICAFFLGQLPALAIHPHPGSPVLCEGQQAEPVERRLRDVLIDDDALASHVVSLAFGNLAADTTHDTHSTAAAAKRLVGLKQVQSLAEEDLTVSGTLISKYITAVNRGSELGTSQFTTGKTPLLSYAYLTGSPTASPYGILAPWQIALADGLKIPDGIAPSDNLATFAVVDSLGAGTTGSRTAISGIVNVSGAVGKVLPGSYRSYVGGYFSASISQNLGGASSNSPATYVGSVFGINPQLIVGDKASYLGVVDGNETDVAVQAGALEPAQVFGQTIVHSSTHAIQGKFDDAAFDVADQDAAVPWRVGIQFGQSTAQWPLGPKSTLLYISPRHFGTASAPVLLNGIDLRNGIFQKGGFAFAAPFFTVRGDTGEVVFEAAEHHAIASEITSFDFDVKMQMIVADATNGPVVGTLPLCNIATNGQEYKLVKADTTANTVSFAAAGIDRIEGRHARYSIGSTQGSSKTLRCNGSGKGVTVGWW